MGTIRDGPSMAVEMRDVHGMGHGHGHKGHFFSIPPVRVVARRFDGEERSIVRRGDQRSHESPSFERDSSVSHREQREVQGPYRTVLRTESLDVVRRSSGVVLRHRHWDGRSQRRHASIPIGLGGRIPFQQSQTRQPRMSESSRHRSMDDELSVLHGSIRTSRAYRYVALGDRTGHDHRTRVHQQTRQTLEFPEGSDCLFRSRRRGGGVDIEQLGGRGGGGWYYGEESADGASVRSVRQMDPSVVREASSDVRSGGDVALEGEGGEGGG
mmetsp:Transcript_40959/g.123569  ORF Transcript_40959/g.123569 Transcript_40959/m.123569 type:complete len:269 (+) Transcript_40959:1068-1874(+)